MAPTAGCTLYGPMDRLRRAVVTLLSASAGVPYIGCFFVLFRLMYLCKVTGTVVAPRKQERFRPAKLLIVQRVDARGILADERGMLALDPRFGAGVGDYVLVAREGGAVTQLMETPDVPANVIVLGVVDDWEVEGSGKREAGSG